MFTRRFCLSFVSLGGTLSRTTQWKLAHAYRADVNSAALVLSFPGSCSGILKKQSGDRIPKFDFGRSPGRHNFRRQA